MSADSTQAIGTVRLERHGAVLTVIIDRPQVRNAVDRDTADALTAAFRDFDADESLAVAVLTGAGGQFCAGADLKAVHEGRGNRLDAAGDGPMGPSRLLLSKPVIAAVEGHAVAGGLELACWCDLRVAAEDATFGVYCRRFGVPLIDGGTVRLPRLIGLSRALDLILTGRAVSASEALAMGLVNRLVPTGTALATAQVLAAELAALPQICLRGDRMSAYVGTALPLGDALAREFEIGQAALAAETLSGATRFARGAGRGGRPA